MERRTSLLPFLLFCSPCKDEDVSGMAEVCGCSLACCVWIWHCIQLLFCYFILGQAVSLGGLRIHMLGTDSVLFKLSQKGPTSSVGNLTKGMKIFFKENKTKPKKPQRPPIYCYVLIPLKSKNLYLFQVKFELYNYIFQCLIFSISFEHSLSFDSVFLPEPNFFFLWDLAIIYEIVFGLHGKVLLVGWTAELTSVRTFQKLSSCPTKPVPTGSRWAFPS